MPYIDIAAYGEIFSKTCATNGVSIAPIRAIALHVPKPTALIFVG